MPKQGTYSLLGVFSLKRGLVFKPTSGQLYPNIGPVPPGNGSRFTCYILKPSELKSEQRNIKSRFALYYSPLSRYKISLDNLL